MPRHPAGREEEQERWQNRGQNLPVLAPNTERRPLATTESLRAVERSNNPTQKRPRPARAGPRVITGTCNVRSPDGSWHTPEATVDIGRKCSSVLDVRESVARELGYRIQRFARKVYRKFKGEKVQGLGTITLTLRSRTGEIQHREAVVWDDTNITFDIKIHHSISRELVIGEETELPELETTPPAADAVPDEPSDKPSFTVDPPALLTNQGSEQQRRGELRFGLSTRRRAPEPSQRLEPIELTVPPGWSGESSSQPPNVPFSTWQYVPTRNEAISRALEAFNRSLAEDHRRASAMGQATLHQQTERLRQTANGEIQVDNNRPLWNQDSFPNYSFTQVSGSLQGPSQGTYQYQPSNEYFPVNTSNMGDNLSDFGAFSTLSNPDRHNSHVHNDGDDDDYDMGHEDEGVEGDN